MWRKFFQYALQHNKNPEKYPAGRVPVEFSKFIKDAKDLMEGFFSDSDSILGSLFIFFLNNPILLFLISFALAFAAFNLIRYSIKISCN